MQLTSENTVYKMIGPVLVPQDQTEAKGNVEKRLEFIQSDMYALSLVAHRPRVSSLHLYA